MLSWSWHFLVVDVGTGEKRQIMGATNYGSYFLKEVRSNPDLFAGPMRHELIPPNPGVGCYDPSLCANRGVDLLAIPRIRTGKPCQFIMLWCEG